MSFGSIHSSSERVETYPYVAKLLALQTSDSILIMIIIIVLLTIQYIFQYLTHEEYIYEYVMILLTYGLFIQNIFSSQRFGKQFLKCRFRLVLQHNSDCNANMGSQPATGAAPHWLCQQFGAKTERMYQVLMANCILYFVKHCQDHKSYLAIAGI